jgi:hypothetical protein
MPKIWVPIVAALVGGIVSLLASQLEVFSKHQTEIERFNDELFLKNRITVYVDFMNDPSGVNRKRLLLVGSKDVLKAMGDLYSNFCKNGGCKSTCPENRAFVTLYQAMRNDFRVTRASPVTDDELYIANYDKVPDC